MRVEERIYIERPSDEVFAFLDDGRNYRQGLERLKPVLESREPADDPV